VVRNVGGGAIGCSGVGAQSELSRSAGRGGDVRQEAAAEEAQEDAEGRQGTSQEDEKPLLTGAGAAREKLQTVHVRGGWCIRGFAGRVTYYARSTSRDHQIRIDGCTG